MTEISGKNFTFSEDTMPSKDQYPLRSRFNLLLMKTELIPIWVYAILLAGINFLWFLPIKRYGAIMGDDASLIAGHLNGSGWREFLKRMRPVHNIIAAVEVYYANISYGEYFLINLLINCLITTILFTLFYRLGKNKLAAMVLSILYITCQFSYYSITQVFGLMEALCILFLLGMIWFGLNYIDKPSMRNLGISVLFGLLAYGSHQRFIVLCPVLLILILISNGLNKYQKIIHSLLCAIPFAAFYYIESCVLGINMMKGTGGTNVSFSFISTVHFFLQGLLDIFGINIGPEYLCGYNFFDYKLWGKICACLIFLCSCFLVISYVFFVACNKDSVQRIQGLRYFAFALCLAGALLLSACFTIRLEMRWIVAPYIVFLCFLAFASSSFTFKKNWLVCIAVILLLSLPNNLVFRDRSIDKIYFYNAMRLGQNAYQVAIQRYGQTLKDYRLYFMGNDEMRWALTNNGNGGNIFDLYLGPGTEILFVNDESEIEMDTKPVKLYKQKGVFQVREVPFLSDVKYDFNRIEKYVIVPDTAASTPNNKGAFLYSGDITIVSGYRLYFNNLVFNTSDVLFLSTYMPYTTSDGAHVTITLTDDDFNVVLCDFDIYPDTELPDSIYNIGKACDDATLIIEVSSPSGNTDSDWVAFDQIAIIDNTQEQPAVAA